LFGKWATEIPKGTVAPRSHCLASEQL